MNGVEITDAVEVVDQAEIADRVEIMDVRGHGPLEGRNVGWGA
ncbi:hypothetical protein ACFU98_25950 [Streptomyces sp. NPDC057575]